MGAGGIKCAASANPARRPPAVSSFLNTGGPPVEVGAETTDKGNRADAAAAAVGSNKVRISRGSCACPVKSCVRYSSHACRAASRKTLEISALDSWSAASAAAAAAACLCSCICWTVHEAGCCCCNSCCCCSCGAGVTVAAAAGAIVRKGVWDENTNGATGATDGTVGNDCACTACAYVGCDRLELNAPSDDGAGVCAG